MKKRVEKLEKKLSSAEIERIRQELKEARDVVKELSNEEFDRAFVALKEKRYDDVPLIVQKWLGLCVTLLALDPQKLEGIPKKKKEKVDAILSDIRKPKRIKRNASQNAR
jgi:ribosomal protein L22